MKKAEKIALVITIILIISAVGGIAFFNYAHKDKILPNVFINGESYENLTLDEAKIKLGNKVKDASGNGITFSFKDKIYTAQPADIGLSIDTERSAKEAYSFGHDKDALAFDREFLGEIFRRHHGNIRQLLGRDFRHDPLKLDHGENPA